MKPFFTLLCSLFIVSSVSAAPAKTPAGPKNKPTTQMKFDGRVVEGEAEGALYGVVEGSGMQPETGIIELRENFLDKLAEDAGEPQS